MGKFRLGLGFAVIGVAAGGLFLMTPPAEAGKEAHYCADPVVNAASIRADECETRADTFSDSLDRATAAYNAARAFNKAGEEKRSGLGASSDFSRAKTLLDNSFFLRRDELLPQASGKKGAPYRTLRVGRHLEKARAIRGGALAMLPANASCAADPACQSALNSAVAELGSEPTTADPYEIFSAFFRTRADIYSSLGQEGPARQDLSRVVEANKNDELAKSQLVQSYSREVTAALRAEPANPDKLRTAIRTFPQVVGDRADAQILLGRSHLRLAQVDQATAPENFGRAVEIFKTAAQRAGDNVTRADALQGQGEALLGLGGKDSEAIARFQEALAADDKVDRKFALGMAYARANYLEQANTQFDAAFPLRGQYRGTKPDLFDALLTRAEVKSKIPRLSSEVSGAYRAAEQLDMTSLRPKLGLGKSLFDSNTGDRGESAFGEVIRANTSSAKDLAAARFYRSIILSRRLLSSGNTKPASWKEALDDAREASTQSLSASVTDRPYKEQACLTEVVPPVRSSSSTLCNGIATPEGQLLLGMSYLRTAQSAQTATSRQAALGGADNAFDLGLKLPQSVGGDKLRVQPFGYGDLPSIRALLVYGKGKVLACYGKPDVSIDLSVNDFNRASAFYGAHLVERC